MTNHEIEDTFKAHRRVAKGIGATALARMGALVEIVAQPLYVLLFGLPGYGLYAVLWAAINLIENFCDLGMTSAMQRTVPKSANDEDAAAALRTAMLLGVGPCVAAAALIAIKAPVIAPLINVAAADSKTLVPAIRLFVWALPLWAFVEIATSALRARMLFGAEIRLRIVWEQLFRLGFAVLFFAMGFGLMGLFAAHICSLTITAFLSLRLMARHYRLRLLFSGPLWPKVAQDTALAGISILPSNIVARLFGDAPALIVNQLLPGAQGAAAGGLFTIARKLSSVVQLVRISFVYVLAPLAASSERHDRAEVQAIYAYAVRLIFVIATPLAVVLATGSTPLLSLFGRGAEIAQTAVIILLIARAVEAVFGISLPVLQVVAAFRHQLTASLVGLGIAVLAGIWIEGRLSPLNAVTLAAAIGLVVTAAVPMAQLWRVEALHPFTKAFPRVALVTLSASAAGGAAAALASHLPAIIAMPLILAIAAASVWAAARCALPLSDRLSLGRTGRRLGLVAA
ncbi:MAG: polysaccharide biosynthesis protein [Pseudomonadota bacterium]